MVELGIVGGRNSGKTTLVEALVHRLVKLNHSVATVKHTAHNHHLTSREKIPIATDRQAPE